MFAKKNIDRAILEGSKILLVEDNMINQDVARAMLNQRGMAVEVAENGEQAVAMVKEAEYDCVLMDVQMPVMDGNEATRIIREELGRTDLPILAMTAKVLETDIKKALKSGMNCHIPKPIDLELLLDEMAYWINAAQNKRDHSGPKEQAGYEEILADCLDKVGGDNNLFLKIIAVFLEKHASDYDAVVSLVDGGDILGARKRVHNLKGVTLVVGATVLHDVAASLETAFDENDTEAIPQLLEQFKGALEETVRYLTDYQTAHSTH